MTATQVVRRESENNSCSTPEHLSVLPEKKASERGETPSPSQSALIAMITQVSLLLRKIKTLTERASAEAT